MRYGFLLALSAFLFISIGCGGSKVSDAEKSSLPPGGGAGGVTKDRVSATGTGTGQGSGRGNGAGSGTGLGGGNGDVTVSDGSSESKTTSNINEQIPANTVVPQNQPRMIVKNAKIKIEHENPESSIDTITRLAEKNGGYIVESKRSTSTANTRASDVVNITLRVPSTKFEETVNEIKTAGGRVLDESIKGEDVTEQFVDIEARLLAQKALEQQFVEIMKRATKVEEALAVQKQLGEVRTEIERIEGRRRYLQNQAALSTIELEFRTALALSQSSVGFYDKFKVAISSGVEFALDFLLGLVSFIIGVLPFLIFIILPIYLFVRYLFKRRKNKKIEEIIHDSAE